MKRVVLVFCLMFLAVILAPSVLSAQVIGDKPGEPRSLHADELSKEELQDLQAMALASGVSLDDAIARYAWNDDFSVVVAELRARFSQDFTGAEILDAQSAWIGFAGGTPKAALSILDAFVESRQVNIEARENLGFSEASLLRSIEAVHFGIFEVPGVEDASTVFDFGTNQISTVVVIDDRFDSLDVRDLETVAFGRLASLRAPGGGVAETWRITDHITVDVVEAHGILGGEDSGSEHLGGEAISTCTSGFGTKTASGTRGIATAGHCSNTQSDDGDALTFRGSYQGTHGDFQWHTGPDAERDDFYAGNSSYTEVNRRDVSSVGSPVVGQSLCRNGKNSHKDCQEVRKVNVCRSFYCSLVQMEARLSTGGDSGGPVYWGRKAYGIHHGWHHDPWPFDRELFSRADKIDDALSIFIATS